MTGKMTRGLWMGVGLLALSACGGREAAWEQTTEAPAAAAEHIRPPAAAAEAAAAAVPPPAPAAPHAQRLTAADFTETGPRPEPGQRAVMACRSGLRAWRAAEQIKRACVPAQQR